MDQNEVLAQKVRAAIGDRALYLAFLYRSFAQVMPLTQAEERTRAAIYEYGKFKGQADGRPMTADDWVDGYVESGGAAMLEGSIAKDGEACEQIMRYCPLMAAWQALGCSAQEIDLFCDIAMEVDRGRADYHGIPWEITHRMAKGDAYCRLVLKKA